MRLEEVNKNYERLINTLIMSCFSDELTDEDIKEYLEELEGDSYTFFSVQNIGKLVQVKILNNLEKQMILKLQKMIIELPNELWNIDDVKFSHEWSDVKRIAEQILNWLSIPRRKV